VLLAIQDFPVAAALKRGARKKEVGQKE